MQPHARKFPLAVILVILTCLGTFTLSRHDNGPFYNGKSLHYWSNQTLIDLPQGKEEEILLAAKAMGPEAVTFWLKQLQTTNSSSKNAYAKLWSSLPNRLQRMMPRPISQRTRRNVANIMLSHLDFTNAIPELIQLSYSKDSEVQEYAVFLLWYGAYTFYRPSTECITAFCSAMGPGNVRTRLWAVQGLNILPLRQESLPALHLALNDTEEEIRIKAATAIVKMQPDADLSQMFKNGIESTNPNVRVVSTVTLQQLERRKNTEASRPN